MTINWPAFVELINANERFLLTSHIRPDCDALGSELGMAGVLESLGKRVTIVNGQATPPNLDFIDPDKKIRVIGEDIQLADLDDIQVLMVLDTSAWAQLGPMGDVIRATKAKKIIVDHHVSEDDLDAELFKNVKAEATGRLVMEAADELGVAITPEIAMPVFAALSTDTGWFRFPSASAGTYRLAAKLIDAGAAPSSIYRDLYERDTLARVKLRGEVLRRITCEKDGRLAYTYIEKADFASTGALPSDTEDLVNMCLEVDGTEAAVIMIEQLTGGFKVSFRSRGVMNCSEVASQFGGGGHKAAAGAFVEGSLEEVKTKVLDGVKTAMG